MALWTFSGITRVSQYQKGKSNLDLLEQEIVSGSGISQGLKKRFLCPAGRVQLAAGRVQTVQESLANAKVNARQHCVIRSH